MEPSTPPQTSSNNARHEADTVKKPRFFHAMNHRPKNATIKDICEQKGIKPDRGKYWLKLREPLGDVACRRRPRSGRLKKIIDDQINEMLDPITIPVRDQPWSAQIEHFHLNICPRALGAAFNQRKPRTSRFKKVRVRSLSKKNKALRVQYAKKHEMHNIDNF